MIDSFAWRGTLISCRALRDVGLPEADFFLYGEDVELAARIRRRGYRIYGVHAGGLKVVRATPSDQVRLFGVAFTFYTQPFRLYYGFRNELTIHLRERDPARIAKLLAYAAIVWVICLARRMRGQRIALAQGVRDALLGKLGKRENLATL